jgi:dephospho-CoA kinase
MRVYGLTGGIASGKTAAADRFRELGFPVIDADKVGHEVIAPGGVAEDEVLRAFGDGILTAGRIDRKKLGARVFADPGELERLNAIVQPRIRETIARRVAELARAGHEAVIIDAALIGEGGKIATDIDGLILVLAPRELRARRLIESRGLTEAQALQRIDAQTPPDRKIPLARWLIHNTGTLEELRARVDQIAAELREA